MIVPTIPGFYTRVRNISHKTCTFSFLPPHGVRLAPGSETYIPGDLRTRLADNPRNFDAFQAALKNGELVIVSTPTVYVYDAVTDNTKAIRANNGVLALGDPSWGAYHSVGY